MSEHPDLADRLVVKMTRAAQLLDCHPRTLRNMIQRGELRSVAIGRHVCIPTDEIRRLLKTVPTAAATPTPAIGTAPEPRGDSLPRGARGDQSGGAA